MVDGKSRTGAFVGILLPLVAPGLVATSIFAFIQAWNEFIFAYILLSDQQKQTLTVWLAGFLGHESRHRLGRADGGSDADGDSRGDLLPDRAAPDRLRADSRGGARMNAERERLAAACIFPSFPGFDAPEWVLRRIEGGLGGICLFGYNVRDREQLAALDCFSAGRSRRPADRDRRGGRRRHPARGRSRQLVPWSGRARCRRRRPADRASLGRDRRRPAGGRGQPRLCAGGRCQRQSERIR